MADMIEIKHLNKYFGDLHVLKDINLTVKRGEKLVMIGPSGSGKSTLIRCVDYLEEPTSGEVVIDGTPLTKKNHLEMARKYSSMVFQQFNLFAHMTVLQNVMLGPVDVLGVSKEEARERAMDLLSRVGVAEQANKVPAQLSGGEQQRVSIARALVRNPPVILADEPTGALDSHTGREVLGLLQQLHKQGHTVVLITHDNSIAVQADRIIRLEDGQVVYDGDSHAPEAMVQPTLLPETPEKEEQA